MNSKIDNTYQECIEKIIKHYGLAKQLLKLLEETDELREAIFNFIDHPSDYLVLNHDTYVTVEEHLIEEMADVRVVLDQIALALDCVNTMEATQLFKAKRTIKRIEEEDNERTGNTKENNQLYI